MDLLLDFAAWAWARHHNILSWYIRPLFLIPFCIFAYRRSLKGMGWTLVALATSMFWFPAPATVDPRMVDFLKMEQEYLAGGWTPWKVLAAALVPLCLFALARAFWMRSIGYGLVVLHAMALGKIIWSFAYGDTAGGMAVAAPALVGLVICNSAILLAVRRLHGRRSPASVSRPATPGSGA